MEDTRSLLEVRVYTVIGAITTVLSLIGNSLVCVAFYRNTRLRTVTNFYVISLAVADVTVAMFVFPFATVASGLRRWPFDYNFCQFTGFFVYYWAQVSLCILALTSINRYYCVVKPHQYSIFFTKKKTALSILSIWVFLFIFYLTFTLSLPVVSQWDPNSFHCRPVSLHERTDKIIYVFYGCFFIIPMLLVVFCYGSVYRVIRQHNATIAPSLQDPNGPAVIHLQDIKACRLLFAAVLGFFACWTPLSVSFLLRFGCDIFIPSVAQSIFTMFSTFSAWINPIIYGVLNRAMRKEFRNVMLCRKVE
ncbi:melatonin receptor type 1A-like [Oculina patagonica]